jgi:hypothetical protein
MSSMLGRSFAVLLVVAGISLPAYAQRGGGRGGFVGSAAPRGGFTSMAHPGTIAAPQFRGSLFGGSRPLSIVPAAGQGVRYGGAYNRGRGFGDSYRYRRTYVPFAGVYGAGLPYPGWIDPDLYDSYDNSAAPPPPEVGPEPDYPGPPMEPGPVEQAQLAPPGSYRPMYQRPLPEPAPEDAVTLVFKDGRPSEQIHNYMLTRSTLYVQDGRPRQIAVADLDLAATEKANRDAGVDFQVPAGR